MKAYYVTKTMYSDKMRSVITVFTNEEDAIDNLGDELAYKEQVFKVEANNKSHAFSKVQANEGELI